MPADTPVTIPEEPTVALEVLLLVHPAPVELVSVVVPPTHTFIVPVIAGGDDRTETAAVAVQPATV